MLKKIHNFLLLIFCCVLSIHCFSIGAFAQKGFKIEKVNSVTVVSNPKNPIPKNGLKKRIVFKEELSIGVIEGDENYMFGEFISFNTDDKGNFYVSDIDNKRIQKYDPQGKYLLTIGRAGQGPGEFDFLTTVRFDKDNNLYVYDFGNQRISFFNRNGKFLRQINTQRMSFDLFVNSKEYIVGSVNELLPEMDGYKVIIKFGLFDKECKAVKILHRDEEIRKRIEGGGSAHQGVFKPRLIYKINHKDIIYYGYPDKYEINICSPEGKLFKKIVRDYEPEPVTKKDKDEVFRQFSEQLSEQGMPEHLIKKVIKNTTFAKYKPVYWGFTLMENGWLFVVVDYTDEGQAIIDLFDKEVRYIAQFKTNIHTKTLFFKNGKAYAVAYEDEFPFVKRYTMELQEYKNGKWAKSTIKLY
jgi:hypothetical protein